MCGIAGHVAVAPDSIPGESVTRMVQALERRGPDSQGIAHWPGASLGHRRLAILDLSPAGHQPMLSDDGRIGVVFNGCIYNFRALRQELEGCGHRFRSQCDTEVLVRGYEQWGARELVAKLHGMFAFAIWDDRTRTLSMARDRLGVKPLAYCASGGELAFASTVAALRSAGFGGDLDPAAVLEMLEFGYVTDERCVFAGISKLPPATLAVWRDGRLTLSQYWSLPEKHTASIGFDEAVEETERLLLDAVRMRLFADVPIGVLLSGGIDSTLVCWAMRELNANIKAFTVRAPEDPSDESEAAAVTARRLGIPHEIVSMPNDGGTLDDLTTAFSEPFSCTSAQAMLWVSSAVKPHATVLLTGDGGDDVFLGYPFFRNAWTAQRLAQHMPAAAPALWQRLRPLVPVRRMRSLLDFATGGIGPHTRAHDGLPYYQRGRMLGERLAGLTLPMREVPPSLASARDLLAEVFRYHRRMHFTSEFMPKVDGATMHYAIEARAPFLDQRLWEFAATLPPEIHFQGGRLKAVLREIVHRRVGTDVASRQKQGFTVPVERWLADRWSGMLDRLLEGTHLERGGWIRPGALAAPIRQAIAARRVPVQIWHLLVLEHWMARYASPIPSKPAASLLAQPA